jgi:dUTP pyrophosphatase
LDHIEVKVKRLRGNEDIPLPSYESDGAAGMDIRAAVHGKVVLEPGEIKLIPTGIAVCIPKGYEGQIRPRSGLALKFGVGMVNSPGTIDSDYRGEIGVIMINWGRRPFAVKRGDRIAQMLITKVYRAAISESRRLSASRRGVGGGG